MSKFPERITKLQCYEENKQLTNTFVSQISSSFKYLPNLLAYIYDEIELIIGFIDYRFTIALQKSQPGDYLQNLTFKFEKVTQKIKLLWLVLNVILPYLYKKAKLILPKIFNQQFADKIQRILQYIERFYKTCEFINLAIFLKKGQYRNLVERILGIQMIFIKKDSARALLYSLMNRKLIWEIYQEFLENVMPFGQKLFNNTLKNVFYLTSYLELDNKQEDSCVVCGNNEPTMPLKIIPCNHKGCYYCLTSSNSNICQKCNMQILQLKKQFQ